MSAFCHGFLFHTLISATRFWERARARRPSVSLDSGISALSLLLSPNYFQKVIFYFGLRDGRRWQHRGGPPRFSQSLGRGERVRGVARGPRRGPRAEGSSNRLTGLYCATVCAASDYVTLTLSAHNFVCCRVGWSVRRASLSSVKTSNSARPKSSASHFQLECNCYKLFACVSTAIQFEYTVVQMLGGTSRSGLPAEVKCACAQHLTVTLGSDLKVGLTIKPPRHPTVSVNV